MSWPSPAFWWEPHSSAPAALLAPVAAIYGLVAGRRMLSPPRHRVAVPVICVGNFVVGGAGKTPTALALATMAKAAGRSPAFLTRGYGGGEAGPLAVDPARHRADTVGDEALLLARAAPTVVAQDRGRGADLLAANGADLIIMDDGFQNPSLAKTVSLLVVDAVAGLGNGRVFPAGPLRAPLAAQLPQTGAIVVIGAGAGAAAAIRSAAQHGKPVLAARLRPRSLAGISSGRVLLAYAGIGRPAKFFASLSDEKAVIGATVAFPDHHRFTPADARTLLDRAEREGLDLITTEKDHARLTGADGILGDLRERSKVFAVELVFENEALLAEVLRPALASMPAETQPHRR